MLEAPLFEKQSVDAWLDKVNYSAAFEAEYVPSPFSLAYVNFVKMVNGEQGEQHPTPVVHLRMLDKLAGPKKRLANLCSRGLAKTTLFFEYLALYVAVFEGIEGFGEISGMIYVSDSMENGVKSARKNIEHRYHASPFLQHWLPEASFTDNYIEFTNRNGHKLGIKMFGAKALSLDTPLFLAAGGTTTIGDCQVGDRIMGADGKPTTITRKSEIFHKPMYALTLQDGRRLKVSEDHLNQVHVKRFPSERTFSKYELTEQTLTTKELLELPLFATDPEGSQRPLIWVENTKPMEWPENQDILIDPYTVGVLIGDGSMNGKAAGNVPVVLTAHEDDWPVLEREFVSMHGLDTHGSEKRVPAEFLYGSVAQRLALLQGLMDTDGTCTTDGKSSFCSASRGLVEDVMWLARSLGGEARWIGKGNDRAFQCSVRIGQPLFRIPRKLERQRPPRNDKMAIVSIERIADEPSQCIAVDNDERQFAAADFFRTHNTGLRGTKIFGKRPTLAVLDDLVSDDDARSKVAMEAINDTVYKGIDYALDPVRRKIVFNGTPFNKGDILYEAVESGGWDVNVWPICERFPCTREEFRGAWPERFSYDFVLEQYQMAKSTGKVSAFLQELMLRIASEDERLVLPQDIRWYERSKLLANRSRFNFYVTTDFAVSEKQRADYNVQAVWAINNNGDWFLVDGWREQATMDKAVDNAFSMVASYRPMSVGMEVTGQQAGFIPWFQREMLTRNIWFSFATHGNSNNPGIRPTSDKLARFNLVLPLFKTGKIYFPEEARNSAWVQAFLDELYSITHGRIKSKNDDCIDNVSQLALLNAWLPGEEAPVMGKSESNIWAIDEEVNTGAGGLSSYVV